MSMATGALLLWALTTARGLSTSLDCTRLPPQATQLMRFRHCSVTIENGYLNAVCNILVGFGEKQGYIPASPATLAIEQMLVSDEQLGGGTEEGRNVCLSLRSIKIKKWDSFSPENTKEYDSILIPKRLSNFGITFSSLLVVVQRLTIKSTFGVPPQTAVAACKGTSADRSCHFEVYGFVDRYPYNITSSQIRNHSLDNWGDISSRDYYGFYRYRMNDTDLVIPDILSAFSKFWDMNFFSIEAVNVTFETPVRYTPGYFFIPVGGFPIKYVLFYQCYFDNIKNQDIPTIENLERLEFFQIPIKKVDPHAFRWNPNLTHSSFIGTKLPGIPEAIFDLTRLHTLDMADTKVPRDTEFQYCPDNCQRNSTVNHLILSGTNLGSLPDRAFCGFPLLKTLELGNCRIANLSGSPFECLENLSNLTMPSNQIASLVGINVKGLRKLLFINLSKNRIVHFEGQKIFSTLISLRSLILFRNDIRDLVLGADEYVPIEELNLAYNEISEWKPSLFALMGKLESLLLDHNGLSQLSEDMLRDISHVKYVNLSWNRWDCSGCQLKNLRSFLVKHPSQCTNCFLCKEPKERVEWFVLEAQVNEDACGPPNHFRIYGVPVLLSIMVASLAGCAVYRKRRYCMYCLLYLKVAVKGRRRQALAGSFLWDGFLSYHASDGEWVRDVFLPKLESDPMNFRLCVAERDFIPGLPITENICRAISQSRASLFVLSREFCRSRWCMFELSMAQHRLFEDDRHDSIVFIRKNDLEVRQMSSRLAYLIKTRTYVQLPPDGSSEALCNHFWLQVQAALEM